MNKLLRRKKIKNSSPSTDFFDSMSVGCLIVDSSGEILQANLTSARLLNIELNEITHQNFHSFISPKSVSIFHNFLTKTFKHKNKEICKVPLTRKDHEPFMALLEAIRLEESQTCRIVLLDITDLEHIEAQFSYQATVLSNMSDAAISTDQDLNILSWNKAAEKMYGWSEREVLGHHIDEICKTQFIGITVAEAQALLLKDGIWRGEVKQQRKDGNTFFVQTSVALIRDANGAILGGITVNTDITQRKQEQEAVIDSETELRTLFAAIHDVIMVIDKDGIYRKIAPTGPNLLYKSAQELLGKHLSEFFEAEQAKEFINAIQSVLETNQTTHIEYELGIDGSPVWFETSISPMPDNQTLWIARDVTNRKLGEKELWKTKILLEKTFASLDQAVLVIESKTRNILACNPAVQKIFGFHENEVIGRNTEFIYTNQAEYERYPQNLIPVLNANNVYHAEIHMRRKDGTIFPAEVTETGILDENGVRTGVVSVIRDITERKHAEEQLRYLGTHDGLTGLYNRSYFDETLSRLEHGRQYPISIVMADVDYMKKVNDSQGHAAGDLLLKNVANILTTTFRAEDIIARVGGDEFAILMPNTSQAEAEDAIQRVRKSLDQHNQLSSDPSIYLSLGVKTASEKTTLSELFREADIEMYADKLKRNKSRH
ncbi:MAG: PAS domain S-box protein [Anaerolineales bacterium]